MSRLAAWCQQGAKMMTNEDLRLDVREDDRIVGYRCPQCSRILRPGYWRDDRRTLTGDSRGWLGTSGMRWPRHYSWAQKAKR